MPPQLPEPRRTRPGRLERLGPAAARDLFDSIWPRSRERRAFSPVELDAWIDQNAKRPVLKNRGRLTLADCEPEELDDFTGTWRRVGGVWRAS